jgi:hypothetical protein
MASIIFSPFSVNKYKPSALTIGIGKELPYD